MGRISLVVASSVLLLHCSASLETARTWDDLSALPTESLVSAVTRSDLSGALRLGACEQIQQLKLASIEDDALMRVAGDFEAPRALRHCALSLLSESESPLSLSHQSQLLTWTQREALPMILRAAALTVISKRHTDLSTEAWVALVQSDKPLLASMAAAAWLRAAVRS